MKQYIRFMVILGLSIFIQPNLITGSVSLSTAFAATQTNLPEELDSDLIIPQDQLRDVIKRLQQGLITLKFYDGSITGTVNAATAGAIRSYQKQNGLEITGIITMELMIKIETAVNISILLDRLSIARQAQTESARQALLNHPSTRDLLIGGIENEAADAARDPSLCYNDPTVRCLLHEALENAKTVNRSEMRNWAYGEILVAQALVGMSEAARETTRRIKDPRLIIAALGEIAQAQALSGNHDTALAAAAIIPDFNERATAFVNIAEILAGQGNFDAALVAVENLQEDAAEHEMDIKAIGLLARASVVLSKSGHQVRSDNLLVYLKDQTAKIKQPPLHDIALRHIASAMASIGDMENALKLLEEVISDSEKMPVLMLAAEAQALAGDTRAATMTAQNIRALRYRAIILSTIGVELAQSGQITKAMEIMNVAIQTRKGIQFPFARDYASSRIALAFGKISYSFNNSTPDGDILQQAIGAIENIKDLQLRAKTYWMLAFNRLDAGDIHAANTKEIAIAATENIESTTSQAWLLADLAEERAKAGDLVWANELYDISLNLAKTIKNSWGRARVLAKLSQALMALVKNEPIKEQ